MTVLAVFLAGALPGLAVPPDLTAGEQPTDAITINLGPTGLRGWVYHVKVDTGESRQILVKAVDAGSPAEGMLAVDDVILGADGSGAVPVNFSADARKSLARAIADAEARLPATLKLLRWRDGTVESVTITLQNLGAYSATAPYDCPKSARILEQGIDHIMSSETAGRYSIGTLSLLAANDASHPDNALRQARAQTEVRALIPTAAEMARMMSDERDATSMIVWQRGYTLVLLAEYYLATGDAQILPAIEAYTVNIARNQSLFGTTGHIFAEKNLDGSDNGPMGGVYGPVNATGLPCFLGLLLARECGLTNPELEPAIERTSRFFAYYAGRGAIPYGEHEAYWQGHENNGKSGLAALAFALQGHRTEEGRFFAKMATASAAEREVGHTGSFFNYLWAPLGAAAGGEEAAASHFSRISWMLDLNRRWDGGFDYDCLNGEGPNSGSQYNNFRMSTAALLTYALPLRQLHITGRGHDPVRWLAPSDVTEAEAVDGYDASVRSTAELVTDLGSWSPKVQRRAGEELATRTAETGALLPTLEALATDTTGTARVGACLALGKIGDASSAPVLAALLNDAENHVRYAAAEGMRYLSQTARISQLDPILEAAASTATPLLPYDEEDPLHFAHARLAMLLFYGGNAYGPKGVIWNSLAGVDRNRLYPAVRAVAANPIGQARSTLYHTYKNLNLADVEALAGTLIDSIHYRAPADKMFSSGVRQGGIETLQAHGIAEGVPLCMVFDQNDGRGSVTSDVLGVLLAYAGSSTTVLPDPDVTGYLEALLDGDKAPEAQAVLDAIAADTNPVVLTPFKRIVLVVADAPALTLPSNETVLRVRSEDLAQGDPVFTWRKVHGAGNVTFSPNGTAESKNTAILFDNVPGRYLFEVNMSDSRGFTEVYETVPVTLYEDGGGLPPNDPPTAHPQTVTVPPVSPTPITLTGSDPEGYALVYTVTSQPVHGALTGTAPNLVYTSDVTYTGPDSFTFEVMDSEGQVSGATVAVTVDASSIVIDVYEPFDYGTGALAGRAGGTGMTGSWADGPDGGRAHVYDETTAATPADTTGGGNQMLSWDGVVVDLPTLPESGSRYVGLDGVTSPAGDDFEAYRPLQRSAGAMAGAGGVLWMSAVWHYPTHSYGSHVGLALATDCLHNRAQNLSTTGAYGSGAGDGIGVGRLSGGVTADSYKLNPTVFDQGSIVAQAVGPLPSSAKDNIVVLKFVFGATDTVSAWSFAEGQTMTEAVFNANAVSASASIDEYTLNVLTFDQNRGQNAIDEIRVGNTFAAVIGAAGSAPDTTPPTLTGVDIVDNQGGGPVVENVLVTYTVSFSEPMDAATVEAADFANAGTSAVTIGAVSETSPGLFSVAATPTTAGTLQLEVANGAVLTDLAGNPLDTAAAIPDDTVITVEPALVHVPDVVGLPQASAEASIAAANLAVGTVTTQIDDTTPAGNVIRQDPDGGTRVTQGSPVDLVVSRGPATQHHYADTDLPVAGTVTNGYLQTHAGDDAYQTFSEIESGGKPSKRHSYLEHTWSFQVTGGASVTFHVEAHHTANTEGDDFVFAYSTDGASGTYVDMVTVTKTSDDDNAQSFSLPDGVSGTVHVRVADTDRSQGNRALDTLYVDEMYFLSTSVPSDYTAWAAGYSPADLGDPEADLDGDGLRNDEERIWGLDPTRASSVNPITVPLDPLARTFIYTRRNPALTGMHFSYESSTTLESGSWAPFSPADELPDGAGPVETVTVTLEAVHLAQPRLFIRVKASPN